MKTRRGFTLIEILVVVAIIALLISIILPAFKEVRRQSKRTVCLSNLKQICTAIRSYLHNNHDTFPLDVASVPTLEPEKRSLPEMLKHEMGAGTTGGKNTYINTVFLCPEDKVTKDPAIARLGPRYFDSQKTSYEWNDVIKGKKFHYRPTIEVVQNVAITTVPVKDLLLVNDFEVWHGEKDKPKTFNALYLNFEPRSDVQR